ncbi:SDR family oxidoreductase [Paracoccaceae bacterium]|nr:SDR family oxidoreductase [Paracoccaceae bacterium]|tara:strand:- start:2046 stop:2792 length:747 start_codon:yes stop_codon:yes gene_type:complete
MRLKGKTAVVTAAGAGIGKATAVAFAEQGAHVIATDISNESFAELEHLGIETYQLDVLDAHSVKGFAEKYTEVDILFNCAGYVHHGSIIDCDEAAFDFSMSLNVKGNYQVSKAFLPNMLKRENASIIFVASAVSSLIAAPNRFIYGVSKAAVIGMMKSIAADFITQGVRANAICPGTVESPSWHQRVKSQAANEQDLESVRKAFVDRQPMGRIGQPNEIAELAVYLASDESSFVTGQAISIDGGWTNT